MLKFAHAKINIGLHVIARRSDGYHELETVFYPIKLYDAVEVLPAKMPSIQVAGVDLVADKNLCMQAYEMLQEDMAVPAAGIHLLKHIPIGAGLGGGSSDATATLHLLNQMFSLNLNNEQLFTYAKKLGADCPFFLSHQAMYAEGTGTDLMPLNLNLDAYHIVVVKPNIHISTAEAYAGVEPKPADIDLRQATGLPIQEWKFLIENDFERSIFARHPEIAELKTMFYETGAIYASMSGSGSAVFGVFDSLEQDWAGLEKYGELFLPQW
ncbi:MAG: 4-(cytidine 5'-diphospho)-2-C-methyl-D-erythritol kinase [Sphingobacterium sp.]